MELKAWEIPMNLQPCAVILQPQWASAKVPENIFCLANNPIIYSIKYYAIRLIEIIQIAQYSPLGSALGLSARLQTESHKM